MNFLPQGLLRQKYQTGYFFGKLQWEKNISVKMWFFEVKELTNPQSIVVWMLKQSDDITQCILKMGSFKLMRTQDVLAHYKPVRDWLNYCLIVNVLKFQTLFSLCSKIRAGIHKMHFRIANRGDPDQTAFSESLIWVYTVCLYLFVAN